VADTGSTGNMKAEVAKNTLTVTDHSSPGQPPLNTIYNFPQSGVLYRTLGTGNFEGIFAANVFTQAMHANGGLGNLTLIAEKGDSEFIVRNNTFDKPWDAPMEIRADGQAGGQNSCKIQVTGNTYIDGIVGDGTTDLGGQSPYDAIYVQVRNNGRMDLTMQNEATPLGLTDTSSAHGTVSLFIQTTSAGDILNLFLQGLQGPRGYRLLENGGTTFNLFRNGSAGGTPQLVLQDNNVRGGAGVDTTNPPAVTATGTITLTNTAPMLPNITPSFAPPVIGGEEQQTAPQHGGNNSASFTTRIGQWLRPMFSAFAAPTNLSLKAIGNWFSPSASAAESNGVNNPTAAVADEPATAPQANTKAIPARTMIVNSRGETRIVPTASLAAMAGELITLPSSGSFTLPAGESTTIMFNAMIGSGFTGTAITNQASVSGSNFSMATSNNLSTPVIQAPNFSKAFSPTTIATNTGVSALIFTLANPNPSQALSAVAFTDSLPAGVEVAASPMAATAGCGVATFAPTAGNTSLTFSAGSIAAGGTCTVSVNVRATTEGAKLNTSSTATSTQANPSGTASATLNVINAPTFTKAFGASTVQLNGTAALSFFITNNSALFPLNGINFTDTLPAGLVVNTPNGLTTTCNGTASAAVEGGSISLSGASLAAGGQCSLTVIVRGTTTGAKDNSATLATTELGANSAATGTVTLTVLGPPTITKAFSPTSITVGGTSNVTLTLTNPNASALNNASFTDTLTNMSAVGGAVTGTCSGTTPNTLMAGATALSFSGITIPSNGSCTVIFAVTSNTPGSHPNATSGVTTTQTPVAGTASNTVNLSVFAPPTITKAFSPTSVAVGGTSTLTLTITNPAGNPAGVTGVAVSDTFPAGMEVHTTPGATNTCGGTFTAAAMATSISLTGGSIASAGGSCSVSVTVKATTGGAKLNTTGTVSSTEGGTGLTASATLSVAQAPTVTKSFSPSTVALNAPSTLTIQFTNTNAFPLTSTAITDSFPAGMEVDATPGATNTCSGTFNPLAAATTISLSGGTIPASGSCAISVNVKGTTAGAKLNTTGNVNTAESGVGGTGAATLTVIGPPAFTKAFSPSSIVLGATSTLNFTITNNNTTSALNGIDFTDVLPTGLSVSDATTNNVCGAGSVLTVTAATRTISLTGGNLAIGNPMPTTCTIPVTVTGIAAGAQLNTTQAITSTEGGTGSTATATLNVFAPPTIAKSFSPTGVQVGGTSTLTITITNPAANPAGVTGVAVSDTFPGWNGSSHNSGSDQHLRRHVHGKCNGHQHFADRRINRHGWRKLFNQRHRQRHNRRYEAKHHRHS
jgi:uncharacterized repeat protein (TIGR01451 family)